MILSGQTGPVIGLVIVIREAAIEVQEYGPSAASNSCVSIPTNITINVGIKSYGTKWI